jgi:hypothetical protein
MIVMVVGYVIGSSKNMADKRVQDFMPYWKNEVKCFEEAKIEGKDTRT